MDRIVGPTLLKTYLRNLGGMQSKGLEDRFRVVVSFKVASERLLKFLRVAEELQGRGGGVEFVGSEM